MISITQKVYPAENWAKHYKYSYFAKRGKGFAIAGIIGGASYTLGYIFLIVVFTYLATNGEGILWSNQHNVSGLSTNQHNVHTLMVFFAHTSMF